MSFRQDAAKLPQRNAGHSCIPDITDIIAVFEHLAIPDRVPIILALQFVRSRVSHLHSSGIDKPDILENAPCRLQHAGNPLVARIVHQPIQRDYIHICLEIHSPLMEKCGYHVPVIHGRLLNCTYGQTLSRF